tara:strand:+ start:265 stop:1008 length:744 start_codon:yes stop_codon:yes gene_type:complete
MIKLINGDCLDHLKSLNNDQIDLILTSPPYNARLRLYKGRYIKIPESDKTNKKYRNFEDSLSMNDYQIFLDRFFQECLRVARISFINLQILTGNKVAIFNLIGKYSLNIKEVIIWDKGHSQPAIQEKTLNSTFEFFLILANDKEEAKKRQFSKAFFDRGTFHNILRVNSRRSFDRSHSATMPFHVVETLLKGFTNEGDLILDPFMGLGTTGLVCKKLERDFIGIEIDPHYFNLAKERISQPIQTSLL